MNSGDKACDVRSKIFGIKIRIELLAFSIANSRGFLRSKSGQTQIFDSRGIGFWGTSGIGCSKISMPSIPVNEPIL